jgi:hypothetical protein
MEVNLGKRLPLPIKVISIGEFALHVCVGAINNFRCHQSHSIPSNDAIAQCFTCLVQILDINMVTGRNYDASPSKHGSVMPDVNRSEINALVLKEINQRWNRIQVTPAVVQ